MSEANIGRRTFCAAAAATVAIASAVRAADAARVEAVMAALGKLGDVELLAGDAGAAVGGVLFTARPSLAALREAVASGCSVIVSSESPFYARAARAPAPGPFAQAMARAIERDEASPPLQAKRAFVREHGLAVIRVSSVGDDGGAATAALAERLGWAAHRRAGDTPVYTPPGLTLSRLAELAHARLDVRGGLRTIGRPDMPIASILLVAGTARVVPTVKGLAGVDALLTGDLREWEVVEYIHDSAEAGQPKALLAVGRILSEQPFVDLCGQTIKTALPGLNLKIAAARDPFWRVQA